MRHGKVDYRMARRAVIRDVVSGLTARDSVCDAHPDLVRAGTHIGAPVADTCPICDEASLRHVTYIFPQHGPLARRGMAVPRESLANQMRRRGNLKVFVVEVCLECEWHHLVEKFELAPKGRVLTI